MLNIPEAKLVSFIIFNTLKILGNFSDSRAIRSLTFKVILMEGEKNSWRISILKFKLQMPLHQKEMLTSHLFEFWTFIPFAIYLRSHTKFNEPTFYFYCNDDEDEILEF